MKCSAFYSFIFIFILSNMSFGQAKISRYTPKDQQFEKTIEDTGNPVHGMPVLIMNYFSPKTGSYLWYLNQNKSTMKGAITDNAYDLYSGIYLEDHGGLLEQITFKDFAGILSQPNYLLDYCLVEDMDKDGNPEFYLTYFMDSDGLDEKPLKVIVYTKKGKKITKAKVTAWIPFQPEDKYRIEKEEHFNKLPLSIQKKALSLLKEIKQRKII
ncbi:hypothetical protein ACTS9E_05910 [Empedobacter brevis]